MSSVKRQSTLRTFGKISKASAFPEFAKPSQAVLATSNKLCAPSKRKRDDSDEDAPSAFEADELAFDKVFAKKVRWTRTKRPVATNHFAAENSILNPTAQCCLICRTVTIISDSETLTHLSRPAANTTRNHTRRSPCISTRHPLDSRAPSSCPLPSLRTQWLFDTC